MLAHLVLRRAPLKQDEKVLTSVRIDYIAKRQIISNVICLICVLQFDYHMSCYADGACLKMEYL